MFYWNIYNFELNQRVQPSFVINPPRPVYEVPTFHSFSPTYLITTIITTVNSFKQKANNRTQLDLYKHPALKYLTITHTIHKGQGEK